MTYKAKKKCGGCNGKHKQYETDPQAPSAPTFIQGINMGFGRARVQADGSILYPKRGWEPPPPMEGFERNPTNPWHFLPKWPECQSRQQVLMQKPCGAIDVKMICKNQEAEAFHTDVTVQTCEGCPHRAFQISSPATIPIRHKS